MVELNSRNMERYPFFSFPPEPSFVAFLDPNVSPYSQISPPGLGVSGVNVFLQIRLRVVFKIEIENQEVRILIKHIGPTHLDSTIMPELRS